MARCQRAFKATLTDCKLLVYNMFRMMNRVGPAQNVTSSLAPLAQDDQAKVDDILPFMYHDDLQEWMKDEESRGLLTRFFVDLQLRTSSTSLQNLICTRLLSVWLRCVLYVIPSNK